jgi:hypothetical protein
LNLIDAKQWEKLILKTQIIKFNFKFERNFIKEISSILEPFRSSFWIKERHWYIGCCCDKSKTNTIVYSIPRFPICVLDYPLIDFPHIPSEQKKADDWRHD